MKSFPQPSPVVVVVSSRRGDLCQFLVQLSPRRQAAVRRRPLDQKRASVRGDFSIKLDCKSKIAGTRRKKLSDRQRHEIEEFLLAIKSSSRALASCTAGKDASSNQARIEEEGLAGLKLGLNHWPRGGPPASNSPSPYD